MILELSCLPCHCVLFLHIAHIQPHSCSLSSPLCRAKLFSSVSYMTLCDCLSFFFHIRGLPIFDFCKYGSPLDLNAELMFNLELVTFTAACRPSVLMDSWTGRLQSPYHSLIGIATVMHQHQSRNSCAQLLVCSLSLYWFSLISFFTLHAGGIPQTLGQLCILTIARLVDMPLREFQRFFFSPRSCNAWKGPWQFLHIYSLHLTSLIKNQGKKNIAMSRKWWINGAPSVLLPSTLQFCALVPGEGWRLWVLSAPG